MINPEREIWRQERPGWCPHSDCGFRICSQDSICIGELPEPADHGPHKRINTHRLCLRSAPDDGEWIADLQMNKGDAWHLVRLLFDVFFEAGAR